MKKYMCMNPECYVSFMALSNPRICQRCGCAGVREAEDAAQAFPGIQGIQYTSDLNDEVIRAEVDEGMISLLKYLKGQ